jgi:tetratricopeptide (TPR) repeat protein
MARWLLAAGLLGMVTARAPAQEALWEIYHDAGSRAQLRGFPAEAERLYKSALDALAKAPPSLSKARTLDSLASLYAEQNRKQEAEEQLKEALAVTEQVMGKDSGPAIDCCLKLGLLYLKDQPRIGLGEPYLNRALAARGKDPGLDVIAGPAGALFTCYLFQNKLDRAEQIIRWCLTVVESKPGPHQAEALSSCLGSLAMVHYKRKQDAEAEADFRRAIEAVEKAAGPSDPALLWILYRAGDFYELLLGRHAQAEALYRRALAIAEKGGEGLKGKQCEFLLAVGGSLHAQGKDAEAAPYYRRFLEAVDKLPPLNDTDKRNIALMLLKAARFDLDGGRAAAAEALTARARKLMDEVPVPVASDQGSVRRGLADCCLAQGKATEAETFARQAREADEKELGGEHGYVALDLIRLARAARERSQNAEAEKLCKQALAIGEKENGIGRPEVREVVDEYAALLRKLNRGDEVKQLEARAAALRLPPSAPR